MKILVTGGAGFIGSHLVDRLVCEGYGVKVYDSFEEQVHGRRRPPYLNSNAEYIKGDMRDKDKLKKAIRKINVIFHEAAAVGVGQSMYQIEKYTDVNTKGTATLLDILVNEPNSIRKIIIASSMSIYGEGSYFCKNCGEIEPHLRPLRQLKRRSWEMKCPICGIEARPNPTKESKKLLPTSIYAMTKFHQEELCLLIGRTYSIPTVALRYFNVYGPRQSLSNPYTGVCAIFSSRIKADQSPLIYEDGSQTRDFIHVKDIIEANLFVLKNKETDYKSFNVGTGKPTSILEIANFLIKLYGKSLKPKIVNKYRIGDIRHCYADISAIKNLGFKPSIKLLDGLKDLIVWAKEEKAIDKTLIAEKILDKMKLKI